MHAITWPIWNPPQLRVSNKNRRNCVLTANLIETSPIVWRSDEAKLVVELLIESISFELKLSSSDLVLLPNVDFTIEEEEAKSEVPL